MEAGGKVFVKYRVVKPIWHERLLLAPVHGARWVICTPEYDIYSDTEMHTLRAEGRQVADAERQLVGLPRLAVLVMDIGGAPELGAVPPRVVGAPLLPQWTEQFGGHWRHHPLYPPYPAWGERSREDVISMTASLKRH
eukprot:6479054-Amphidinium_carterae.3